MDKYVFIKYHKAEGNGIERPHRFIFQEIGAYRDGSKLDFSSNHSFQVAIDLTGVAIEIKKKLTTDVAYTADRLGQIIRISDQKFQDK